VAPVTPAGDLFDRLARRYDRGNRIVSLGQDLRWKRRAVALLDPHPGGTYADVGAGTGDLARMVAEAAGPSARIVALDASRAMLAAGRFPDGADVVVGDAQRLPLASGLLDGIVTGFLLRNLPDVQAFLASAARALAPGRRLVVLEIAYPRGHLAGLAFRVYFHGVAPLLGGLATGRWRAYRYLSRSLRGFPAPEGLAQLAERHGLRSVALERSGWLGLFVLALEKAA
jgi:demethylmenaquinone methyltransferase/2-methoxy-6-polyprenyl-1,4-benzoquinol methylase